MQNDSKITLLIIEDNDIDRQLYRRHLSDELYEIYEAVTGMQGIAMYKDLHPDCVLLDHQLPDLTGLDLLQELHKEELVLPVIIVTGFEKLDLAVEAIKNGAQDYLCKNHIIPSEFNKIIRSTIDKVSIHRDLLNKNKELEASKEEAIRSNEMKNEFLAMMSHEIRTPLNNVIGISEILMEDGLAADKRDEYINIIRSSGGLLLSVINDVLDYSKIEAEELKIQPARISLRTSANEVVRLLKLKAKEHCVSLSVNFHEDTIDEIMLDPVRLKQVLINLVDNAIKYSQGGEVFIDVETKDISPNEKQLLLVVRDNGIGIPEECLDSIFNRFDKGMYYERNMLNGTGLGLYIVRKLLELMGGSISVQSVLGKGTEFQCSIPISFSDEQHDPIKDMIDSRHFLVVDDEAINHDIMQRYFSSYKMQPYISLSGRAALTLLNDMYQEHHKNIIDVMLIDCMMPGMDGIELIEEIKKDPRFKDIFIILMSSADVIVKYKHSNDDTLTKEPLYDACMVKPLYEDHFFEKLGIILMNYMINNQKKVLQ